MTGDIVDSGGIDDHHCLSCLFIMMIHGIILISVLYLEGYLYCFNIFCLFVHFWLMGF